MAGSYIPLVGGDNLVSITDITGPTAYAIGTINGATPVGRAGKMRTSLLLALDNATANDNIIPFAAVANLATIVIECPPGLATPDDLTDTSFDYSTLLPRATATLIAKSFDVTTLAWPSSLSALLTEISTSNQPANLANLFLAPTAAAAPSSSYPYGTLTFTLSGKAVTADIPSPLLMVDFDFGASIAS